ncbi:hypothetical protein N7491_007734 [Penicillium cf. griseofulvum]|uniref:Zn(2)-C6 fungal-type domain-containing protein n=1 Tax=Penicillium cf. griseofulvum TaxID=2972120 RepID=A0A9W9ITE6_9EURO|nr:hypothetical protein N7472_009240 [Penicillium cf. griseofulvum]KAJ5430718.1 hypothetical protein N7491_007734 [Penicillium cf. griseofulvum]
MLPVQSHVRNACDACHKRKIRCIMSRSGGSCIHCEARGLRCYFLPRYKSGRPRRPKCDPSHSHCDPSDPSHDTADSHTTTSPGSLMNSSFWPAENTVPSASAKKSPPGADSSSNEDLFVWDSHQDFAIQMEQHNFDLQDSDLPLKFRNVFNGALLDIQQPTFPNFANQTGHSFINIQSEDLPDATSPSPPDMQTSVSSTTSQQPSDRSDPPSETSKDTRFVSLLEHCARLQRHIMTMEEDDSTISDKGTSKKIGMSNSPLREVLEDIDASCKLMFEMCDEGTSSKSTSAQVNSPPDLASISLITTVAFKVFQICDILFNGQGLKIRSIKDVLLQKRLDFNITQAGIVTARIEHLARDSIHISQELLRKAVHIEERFTSQRGGSFTDMGKFRS